MKTRLLFIGESPPASGRFFYHADSGLYRAFRDAFQSIDPAVTDENFLEIFEASGCRLIDLCPEPADKLCAADRRAACVAGEPALSRTIAELRPDAIATVVRSIHPNVKRAASKANWTGRILDLPYPGRWSAHREKFLKQLIPELPAFAARFASNSAAGTDPSSEH